MRTVCCSDRLGRGSAWGGSVCPGGCLSRKGLCLGVCVSVQGRCLARACVYLSVRGGGGVYSAGVGVSTQQVCIPACNEADPPFRGQTDTLRTLPFCSYCCRRWKISMLVGILPPATKLGQGYVFTGVCDSVNRGGMRGCQGACMVAWGHAWFFRGVHGFFSGGMSGFLLGCVCVFFFWGHAWFFLWGGACMVFSLGGACLVFSWGMHGFFLGGMHGFWGGCVVVHGCWGVNGCRGACIGYDEIRSMSGRYASYWNAFLFNTSLVCAFVEKFFDTLDTHLLLPPANWSLRPENIFTGVCQSFCSPGGGGLCPGGVSLTETPWTGNPPPDRDPYGHYASYWNAFLLLLFCVLKSEDQLEVDNNF